MPGTFAATPAHDRLKLPALADAVSYQTRQGSYSVITEKQAALFTICFISLPGYCGHMSVS